MNQDRNMRSIEDGFVLRNKGTSYFKLFGRYYTTNLRRKKRYSMDNEDWEICYDRSFYWRLKAVFTRKAKRL